MTTGKAIWTFGAVFLLAVASVSTPAMAKERKSHKQAVKARVKAGRRHAAQVCRRKTVAAASRGPIVLLGQARGRTHVSVGFGLGTPRRHTTCRTWVPGRSMSRFEEVCVEPAHHEWRLERVEVEPGHYETRCVAPVEEILYDSRGNAHKVVVRPGLTEQVWVPARYETRRVKVRVPARYETREVRLWVPGHWVCTPCSRTPRCGFSLRALLRF